MKRLLLLTTLISLLISCSSRKQIEKELHSGNYDYAISNAIKKLKSNKDKKRKQEYIVMLEDAYQKAVSRDLKKIEQYKDDGNPELYKSIYEIYTNLDARQETIKPLLPLYIGKRTASFKFIDYNDPIVEFRYKTSDYLADKGLDLLDSDDKYNARDAYKIFNYIEHINPNFEDVRQLRNEAHVAGTNYVFVSIENQTNQIIPARLEEDLLNFDTYGLNKFWTVYSTSTDIDYDFAMKLQLKRINISPERITERQYIREKEIIDGWEYQLDNNGNVIQDSLGNDIKIDKIVNVNAKIFEFIQLKSTQVIANTIYIDSKSNELLDTFAIDSEFIFENLYIRFRGDKRALTVEDIEILNNGKRIPFPSNEQMVYDTGEDLKFKLKKIINSYNL